MADDAAAAQKMADDAAAAQKMADDAAAAQKMADDAAAAAQKMADDAAAQKIVDDSIKVQLSLLLFFVHIIDNNITYLTNFQIIRLTKNARML